MEGEEEPGHGGCSEARPRSQSPFSHFRARAAYLRKSVSADDHLDMGSDYSPGTAVEGKPTRSNKGKLKRKFVSLIPCFLLFFYKVNTLFYHTIETWHNCRLQSFPTYCVNVRSCRHWRQLLNEDSMTLRSPHLFVLLSPISCTALYLYNFKLSAWLAARHLLSDPASSQYKSSYSSRGSKQFLPQHSTAEKLQSHRTKPFTVFAKLDFSL